jgi:HlyD family secretion protein
VKIRIQEKELFRPGMSVTAEIETRYRTNVLAVPIQSVTTRVPKKTNEVASGSKGANTVRAASQVPRKESDKKELQKPIEVVFALEGDRVNMIPVRRGISDDAFVEVTDGLTENLEIISGGYKAINRDLEHGKRVKVGPADEKPDKDEKK